MPKYENSDDIKDDDEFAVNNVDVLCATMIEFIETQKNFPLLRYMSAEQLKQLLVTEYNLGDKNNVVISLRKLEEFQSAVCDIILGRMLSKLAAEGVLNVAWDPDSNEPVFSLTKDYEEHMAKLEEGE
jgi:hypothetical protein